MALTNEQLVMLNALGYYSEFSDDYIPIFDDQSKTYKYKTIENFVADAGQYTTCFNGVLELSDEDLGMTAILDHGLVKKCAVKNRPKIRYCLNSPVNVPFLRSGA